MKELIIDSPKYGRFVSLIDDEDYEKVMQGPKWGITYNKGDNSFYIKSHIKKNGKRTTEKLHDFIMNADTSKGEQVDHIEHNTMDNRKEKLRIVTCGQNLMNRKIFKNNKSGYKGVKKVYNKWVACIGFNKKDIYIGTYDTDIEAARAYNNKALELFGEYARPNFIKEHENIVA